MALVAIRRVFTDHLLRLGPEHRMGSIDGSNVVPVSQKPSDFERDTIVLNSVRKQSDRDHRKCQQTVGISGKGTSGRGY